MSTHSAVYTNNYKWQTLGWLWLSGGEATIHALTNTGKSYATSVYLPEDGFYASKERCKREFARTKVLRYMRGEERER